MKRHITMCAMMFLHTLVHSGNTVTRPSSAERVDESSLYAGNNVYDWVLHHPQFVGYIKTAQPEQLAAIINLESSSTDSKKMQRDMDRLRNIAYAELLTRPALKNRRLLNKQENDKDDELDYNFLVICNCVWP